MAREIGVQSMTLCGYRLDTSREKKDKTQLNPTCNCSMYSTVTRIP